MKLFSCIKKICAIVFLLFVLLEMNFAKPAKQSVSLTESVGYLEKAWTKLRQDNLVDGVMLIQQGKNTVFSNGDPTELYAIASLSKSFVGFRYYELQKNHGLDLEEKLCKWLPKFCQGDLKKISLRHLLNHRAGFGRDLSFLYFLSRSFDSQWKLDRLDSLDVSEASLKFHPGSNFAYSNFGYLLLSRVLEKIENKSFVEIISDLGKRHHLPSLSVAQPGDVFARTLLRPFGDFKWKVDFPSDAHKSYGSGGVVVNAQDLLEWLAVIEKSNLLESSSEKYQAGIVKGKDTFWHNGATLGLYTLMANAPKQDLKVVMLTKNFKITNFWTNKIEQYETIFY